MESLEILGNQEFLSFSNFVGLRGGIKKTGVFWSFPPPFRRNSEKKTVLFNASPKGSNGMKRAKRTKVAKKKKRTKETKGAKGRKGTQKGRWRGRERKGTNVGTMNNRPTDHKN